MKILLSRKTPYPVVVFNTGRMYSEAGQVIAAALIDDKIHFNDVSRGIPGVLDESFPNILFPKEILCRTVMDHYDRGKYTAWPNPEIRKSLSEWAERALSPNTVKLSPEEEQIAVKLYESEYEIRFLTDGQFQIRHQRTPLMGEVFEGYNLADVLWRANNTLFAGESE